MYGQRGKVRNSDTWRQVGRQASQPMFLTTAAERIKAWETKVAAEQAAAKQAGK